MVPSHFDYLVCLKNILRALVTDRSMQVNFVEVKWNMKKKEKCAVKCIFAVK